MRILYVFLLGLLLLPAGLRAQPGVLDRRVTVALSGVTLAEALQALGGQCGVAFAYSSNVVPAGRRVSLRAASQPLAQVLDGLLGPYGLTYRARGNRVVLRRAEAPLGQTVKGTVIDRASRAPIPGASVRIAGVEPPIGTTTDATGTFRLPQVPVGRQTVLVSHVSYETYAAPNLLVGTGAETVLPVELVEAVTSMAEVVVTDAANRLEPLDGMAAVSARPLPMAEAKRYAASLNDPARIASGYAGVSGDDYLENALVVRGNSSRGLLWRLEGVEIPNPNHFADEGASGGGVSIVSAHVLANSDFLTGAFPARYGNALSGVLDLRLRNGNAEKREYAVQAGTMGLDVALEGPFRKGKGASYLVNGRYSLFSLLNRAGFNVGNANAATGFGDAAFKLHFPAGRAGVFSVFGVGGLSGYRLDSAYTTGRNRSDMGVLGVSHGWQADATTSLRTVLALSGTRIGAERTPRPADDPLGTYRDDFRKTFARASVTLHKKLSARHLLEAGATYSHLSYRFRDSRETPPAGPGRRDGTVFDDVGNMALVQGYLSCQYRPGEKLTLTGGLHALYFGLNGRTAVEPRAGLAWKFRTGQALRAGLGMHSRVEPLQYYFARFVDTAGRKVQYNRHLGFTKARHYVLGYDWQPAPHLSLRLETYYQDVYNVPVRSGDSLGIFSTISVYEGFTTYALANRGTGDNYGVELSVEKSFAKHHYLVWNGALYRATYLTLDGPRRNTPYNGAFNTHLLAGREFRLGRQAGRHGLNLNLRGTWAGGKRYIPVDLAASVARGREMPDLAEAYRHQLDNYARLDLQVAYRFNRPRFTGEWRLDVFNVTNHRSIMKYYYDPAAERVAELAQLGTLPVLACRLEF
ncbi:MAG: carboxypeptidase-like regulatory domain-containing protein [Cytophagales bacterium]|nr:carboxypeptidase-like regulatory domain-containing protein [Cytophagales bacterium]